ncbi:MAG: hypothetical protein LBT83_10055, partial [Tannerella sp.]|nr:hypothetical protein [Tannerella sp.]
YSIFHPTVEGYRNENRFCGEMLLNNSRQLFFYKYNHFFFFFNIYMYKIIFYGCGGWSSPKGMIP